MSVAEKQDVFQQEAEMMKQLALMDWAPPEDESERDLAAFIMEEMKEGLRPFVRSMYTNVHMSTVWATQTSQWEVSPLSVVAETRRALLAACHKAGCDQEFVEDAKRRWSFAEFTSVTKQWYVLGHISVPRPQTCTLPESDEKDLEAVGSDVGRRNLTYLSYQEISRDIEGVRLKINGDRFVVSSMPSDTRGSRRFSLVGFKTMSFEEEPSFSVVEYYAGHYYIIAPAEHVGVSLYMRTPQGRELVTFHPHPFKAAASIPEIEWNAPKYEGVMMLCRGIEYRAKWVATAEVLIEGVAWEIRVLPRAFSQAHGLSEVWPMRPRPGKAVISLKSAKTQLLEAMPGKALVSSLRSLDMKRPISQPVYQIDYGAKVLFVNKQGYFSFITDKGKKWDLIGGKLEYFETPIQALVREIKEETGVQLQPEKFLYLGESVDLNESGQWRSHVFLADFDPRLVKAQGVSTCTLSLTEVLNSNVHYQPRQAWVNRHLRFLLQFGTNGRDLYSILALNDLADPVAGMALTTDVAVSHIPSWDIFLNKLWSVNKTKDSKGFDVLVKKYFPSSIPSFLEAKGLFLDEKLRPQVKKQTLPAIPGLSKRRMEEGEDSIFLTPEENDKEHEAFESSLVDTDKVQSGKHMYPDSRIVAESLLREIFGKSSEMAAQDLYIEFSRRGYPGTRANKVKFAEKCLAWGLLSEKRLANGRRFTIIMR
jgi:ADP-ribose pyrophosphatase YjhB (NUDIX family)